MRALLFGLVLLVAFVAPVRARATNSAKITYVTGSGVYVDAGTGSGLAVGAKMQVVRDEVVVATLEVVEVSARRALCRVVGDGVELSVGDAVAFEPTPVAPVEPRTEVFERPGQVSGRLGLQWLQLRDQSDFGSDVRRPAIDLRLRGEQLFGRDLDLDADVRARHTTIDSKDGTTDTRSRQRVYRLNATWRMTSSDRLVLGRQYASQIGSITLFDGAQFEHRGDRFGYGALVGVQPDPDDLGPSTEAKQAGLWASMHRSEGLHRWEMSTALVSSFSGSNIDREFAVFRGFYTTGPWRLHLTQELDVNRGWKKSMGQNRVEPTATHLIARWQIQRRWSADTGFDSRRRVLLWRDRETPESEFDDRFRRSVWLGVQGRRLGNFDVGIRLRTQRLAASEPADAVTLRGGWRSLGTSDLYVGGRSTFYRNRLVRGWLVSSNADWTYRRRLTLSGFGGVRHEVGRETDLIDSTDPWFGASADLYLEHGISLGTSWERSFNGEEAFDQLWAGTSLRF